MRLRRRVFAGFMALLLMMWGLLPAMQASAAKKVKLNRKTVSVFKGKTVKLKVLNTKKKVKWSTSNKRIATVTSKGVVKGKRKGKAKITAKVAGKKYVCKVTVKEQKKNIKTPKPQTDVTSSAEPTSDVGASAAPNPNVTPSAEPKPEVTPSAKPEPSGGVSPTPSPTGDGQPTQNPSENPTANPTDNPTAGPTQSATENPTDNPTAEPTQNPTENPTDNPTAGPTQSPTENPTDNPTAGPTQSPTANPTQNPTAGPTQSPTVNPTQNPTARPTQSPTASPTQSPTARPTQSPTVSPTQSPTARPTQNPTVSPTQNPTQSPTQAPDVGGELKPATMLSRISVGMSQSAVEGVLGSPVRNDSSPLGFTVAVYKDDAALLLVSYDAGAVIGYFGMGADIAYGTALSAGTTRSALESDSSWSAISWYCAESSSGAKPSATYEKVFDGVRVIAFTDYFAEGQKVFAIEVFSTSYTTTQLTKPSAACRYDNSIVGSMEAEIFDMINVYRAIHGYPAFAQHVGMNAAAKSGSQLLADNGSTNVSCRSNAAIFNAIEEQGVDPDKWYEYVAYGSIDSIGFGMNYLQLETGRNVLLEKVSGQYVYDKIGISCVCTGQGSSCKNYLTIDFAWEDPDW